MIYLKREVLIAIYRCTESDCFDARFRVEECQEESGQVTFASHLQSGSETAR
jgi:hypothetical protein